MDIHIRRSIHMYSVHMVYLLAGDLNTFPSVHAYVCTVGIVGDKSVLCIDIMASVFLYVSVCVYVCVCMCVCVCVCV